MKTKQMRKNKISILLLLTGLILFPFISNGQLEVDTLGNVGIGTSTPYCKLQINKNGTYNSENTENLKLLASDNTGMIIGTDPTANIGYIQSYESGHAWDTKPLVFQAIGGNVGIGSINPGEKLVVAGNLRTVVGGNGTGILTYDAPTGGSHLFSFTRQSNDLDIAAYGGIGLATNATGGAHTGYTLFATSTGNVGIGTSEPGSGYKLDVQGGDINTDGSVRCNGIALSSDQMFKTNIDTLHNALNIINLLKPKSYYFDTLNFNGLKGFNFPSVKQYGFIAQEIETILPELVSFTYKAAVLDTLGNTLSAAFTHRALNYISFIAILTKGIQEQQRKIDSLKTKTIQQDSINTAIQTKATNQDSIITSLQNQLTINNTLFQNQRDQLRTTINNCCNRPIQSPSDAKPQTSTKQTSVELNDAQAVVLEQNLPNPFSEQTAINYSLPDNTFKAQMLFYNAQGKLIQSTELTQKGKGTLNVFASDLSSGIYTYTLVVDGKIIETKKMVKQ